MNNGMNQGMNNGHVYNNHKNDGESWWTKTPKRNVVEKWIGGVCAGLGDYFGISATLVRLLRVRLLLPLLWWSLLLTLWLWRRCLLMLLRLLLGSLLLGLTRLLVLLLMLRRLLRRRPDRM